MNSYLDVATTVERIGGQQMLYGCQIGAIQLKTRIEHTRGNPQMATGKDYVIIAGKVVTLTLDVAALGMALDFLS